MSSAVPLAHNRATGLPHDQLIYCGHPNDCRQYGRMLDPSFLRRPVLAAAFADAGRNRVACIRRAAPMVYPDTRSLEPSRPRSRPVSCRPRGPFPDECHPSGGPSIRGPRPRRSDSLTPPPGRAGRPGSGPRCARTFAWRFPGRAPVRSEPKPGWPRPGRTAAGRKPRDHHGSPRCSAKVARCTMMRSSGRLQTATSNPLAARGFLRNRRGSSVVRVSRGSGGRFLRACSQLDLPD